MVLLKTTEWNWGALWESLTAGPARGLLRLSTDLWDWPLKEKEYTTATASNLQPVFLVLYCFGTQCLCFALGHLESRTD